MLLNFGIKALGGQLKDEDSALHHYTGLIGLTVSGTFLMLIAILNLVILVFRSEKVTKAQVIGLLLGFVGVLTVLGAWRGLGSNPLSAVLALLFSVACYGVSFPYSRKFILPLGLRPEAAAATQLVIDRDFVAVLFNRWWCYWRCGVGAHACDGGTWNVWSWV